MLTIYGRIEDTQFRTWFYLGLRQECIPPYHFIERTICPKRTQYGMYGRGVDEKWAAQMTSCRCPLQFTEVYGGKPFNLQKFITTLHQGEREVGHIR